MSWSLDPRRPDPKKNPEGWYKFWENEIKWSYSRPWECLVKVCNIIHALSRTFVCLLGANCRNPLIDLGRGQGFTRWSIIRSAPKLEGTDRHDRTAAFDGVHRGVFQGYTCRETLGGKRYVYTCLYKHFEALNLLYLCNKVSKNASKFYFTC